MKITFLGTGSMGCPLAFCNCDNCKKIRETKGKSIRKKASLLINDDLLIDISPDTQSAMDTYDKDMGNISYLLITHAHQDHVDTEVLTARMPYQTEKNLKHLELVASEDCINVINTLTKYFENIDLDDSKTIDELDLTIHKVNHNDKLIFGDYEVKVLESTHAPQFGSLIYLIKYDNKTILYATDSKEFTDDVVEALKEYKLDILIMDHTLGAGENSYSHLNENAFIRQIETLKKFNIVNKNTLIYGTHISHEVIGIHEDIEERAIKNGYHMAYDGLEIEI